MSHLVQGALRFFLSVATAALLITILARGQAVIIPLALATMIAFILNTPVAALDGRGLPRFVSIVVVVFVAFAILVAFGYVLTRQFTDFVAQMPQYSASIESKLVTLRETRKSALGKIQDTVDKVSKDLDKQEKKQEKATGPAPPEAPAQPVSIVPTKPNDVERLRSLLEPIVRPVATGGIVLILTSFMLARREDLRNRLIRLVGRGRVTITTRTLDEAAHRISTFLFTQTVINVFFGVCVAGGLLVIGVPYALLWGVAATVLRFVPYLGTLLALLMPATMAFVVSPGWGPTIETVVLFVALDMVTANVIEPVLIGTHTGISSLALLVAAMFWTWLWGPVGLILSTPITVCVAAVGKYVPGMEFLAVILGDEPPLEARLTLYQRLLAGDEDEASDILDEELAKAVRPLVFDRVVIPAVVQAGRDRLRGEISQVEYLFVVHTVRDLLRGTVPQPQESPHESESCPMRRILGVPVRNEADELALDMLSQLLPPVGTMEQLTTATLASETLSAIGRSAPDLLCVVALPPGGLSHIRYLCKRVHQQFPDLPICVLRANSAADPLKVVQQISCDGARQVATSFVTVTTQLTQFLSSPREQVTPASSASRA